jgi:hypothetical protein
MGPEMDADGCAGAGAPRRLARRQTTAGERAAAGAQAAAGTATSRTRPAMETDQAEGSFEGNAANKELRERMALAPNLPSDAR